MAEKSGRHSSESGIIFDVLNEDLNLIELFFSVVDELTGVHINNLKDLVDKFLRIWLQQFIWILRKV